MGAVGELFALAGLKIDKGSFAAYAAELNSAESKISSFSSASQTAMAGAFLVPAGVVTGIAAIGTQIASGFQDAGVSLTNLYGDLDVAREKFQWLGDFAASTPFAFPELMDATIKLKAYGIEAQDYLGIIGDTAASMGKSLNDTVEALADAQTGEFERLKEFGIKAVEITKKNYQQLGVEMASIGQTALTYVDKNGKQMAEVVDRNNREMITSTITAIWNDKYAGAMETRSKTLSGMWSTLKDNLSMGLADVMGYDMKNMEVQTLSLMGVFQSLMGVAVSLTGALSGIPESMQTFLVVAALGVAGIGALAAGFIAYGAILPLVTAETAIFGVTLSAALWPATLIVGALALVAAGLVYLDEKTGIVTYSWNLLKDLFTITVDGILQAARMLWDGITIVMDGIKQAIVDMFPPGFLEGVSNVVSGIISQFTNMGINIHTQAEEIRNDNTNIGTSATDAGNQVTGAAGIMAGGYDTVGQSALLAGGNVQNATGQIVSGNNAAGQSATQMGANTQAATGQMAAGFSLVTSNATPMVYAIQSGVSPVNALKAAISGATGTNYAYSASFVDVSNKANAAASAAISAANRIGSAIKTNIAQVGELEALAGKWNTRAKLGVTSSGGSGTGEGNVKVVDKTGQYAAPVTSSGGGGTGEKNVKITTYNNYAGSTSKNSIKAVS